MFIRVFRLKFDGLTVIIVFTLYCTVLYCTVLHCTVLYCTALYYTVLYCTVFIRPNHFLFFLFFLLNIQDVVKDQWDIAVKVSQSADTLVLYIASITYSFIFISVDQIFILCHPINIPPTLPLESWSNYWTHVHFVSLHTTLYNFKIVLSAHL